MIVERMIDAMMAECKRNLLEHCSELAELELSPKKSGQIVAGLQKAANAAAKAAFRVYLESKEETRDVLGVGGELYRFKYTSERSFLSPWGKVRVGRRLYQNAKDKTHIPLEAAWGMSGEFMMAEVREAVAYATAHLTSAEAAKLLRKTSQFHPHRTQIEAAIKSIDARVSPCRAELDKRVRAREEVPDGVRSLVASMDGANVLLGEPGKKCGRPAERPKGGAGEASKTSYKNAMAGSFSFYGPVKEGEKCPQRLRTRYTVHMPEDLAPTFKRRFEAELDAAEALCEEGVVKVILCDGARSIWTYIEGSPRFASYETLIDYWHAVEHLSLASEALFGKGTNKAKAWYKEYADKLLEKDNGARSILKSMAYYTNNLMLPKSRLDDLKTQRTFFERNQSKMTYADFRRRGLPIGSGPVEAACKTLIKSRMCRSGMRWSREGGQRILDLRCYVKSNRWDAFWNEYMKLGCVA